MGGLDRNRVRIEPHQSEWQRSYEAEVDRLSSVVGRHVQRFEHVGSTAVEGIPAKPVIDILALVEDRNTRTAAVDPIEDAGYELRSSDDERLFFAKGPETGRTHYLHVAEVDSEYATEMLAFRDHLRANPDTAEEYADRKRSLAERFPADRDAYTQQKAAFIERILDDAMDNQ